MTDQHGWQPIETAPGPIDKFASYGPLILVWDGKHVSAAKKDRSGYFADLESVDRDGEWLDLLPAPRLWQPLPPPPGDAA